MTNKEILERAIRKAIDGGWKVNHRKYDTHSREQYIFQEAFYSEREPYYLIFSHDFAKALWGEANNEFLYNEFDKRFDFERDLTYTTGGEVITAPAYLWHLQQMVIAPDPIKYLGEHLQG